MARIALVTGGVTGIGAATCKALKKAGHTVVANYFGNAPAAERFRKETGIPIFEWDVADFDACQVGVAKVADEVGPVDILVNNAGVNRDSTLHKMTKEQWRAVIDVDLGGCFNMCRRSSRGCASGATAGSSVSAQSTAWPASSARPTTPPPRRGSSASPRRWLWKAPRATSPSNAIAPGYTDTAMVATVPPDMLKQIVAAVPVGRLGRNRKRLRGASCSSPATTRLHHGRHTVDQWREVHGNSPLRHGTPRRMDKPMSQSTVVLCAPVRTAIGAYKRIAEGCARTRTRVRRSSKRR